MGIKTIPADNYCGIILKAEEQEDRDIYDNVKWRRIYLWVDIAKGLYQGYFSQKYLAGGKKEWEGVMSIYLPTTDNFSGTDDANIYKRYQQNMEIMIRYNNLDKLPLALEGLLVSIQIYRDDVGTTRIRNYFSSSNYQVDATFADTNLSHYAQIDDIQYYSPKPNLSNALTPTITDNNSISPAKGIAARRRQKTNQLSQSNIAPPIIVSPPTPPPSSPPQSIARAVTAEQAVAILQSMYDNKKLVELYKYYLAINFLPPSPSRKTNSLDILYNSLRDEFREICFTSITNLQSADIGKYDNPFSSECQYREYINFEDNVNKIIGQPTGQYCRLFKYLSAYNYSYFADLDYNIITDKYNHNDIDLKDDKTAEYILQKQFRKAMYDVIYPNSIIKPLWLVDDIPVDDFIKNTFGLAMDADTRKIRFRVNDEVFGMEGYIGVDSITGLSMYRSRGKE